MNPDLIQQLDRVVHEKGRMAIIALLAASPSLSFTELRDTLGMSDGNLTTHLRTLQEAGYIAITKFRRDKRPVTTCALTDPGRAAFVRHVDLLASIVQSARSK